jgi:hypothetical protein
MKKLLLMAAAISLSNFLVAQQPDIVISGSNKITKELTPQQIIDSLQKRFPNAKAVEYYQTSPAAVKAGWAINEQDNLGSDDQLDYYTLSFKNEDFQYYGLYKPDGTLVKSKYEETDANLPDAVKTSLKNLAGTNYKDYDLLSKKYYKRVNNNTHKEYYEVVAVKKGTNEKKTVTLNADGTVLKEQ